MSRLLGLFLAMGLAAAVGRPLCAAPLTPTRYDMPNGYGRASGGNYNYWDLNYSGTGATNVDGAALAGGLGDLTDGVVATDNWFAVENVDGTGPYVGWVGLDPTITFHFANPLGLVNVRAFVDDSDGNGGVSAPTAIVVNGQSFPVVDPPGPEPLVAVATVDYRLLAVVITDLSVQLVRGDDWVFASQFQFDDGIVPEPAAGSLSLLALAGGAVGLRRGRREMA